MALTIAVGFVVDDAIVMVEVIWQRIEAGETPFDAALAGSGEISFTILSISISLIAVFTPLMFMGGVVGLLMREFAITLSAAVLVSLVLSLTADAHAVRASSCKPPKPPSNRFTKALETGFRPIWKTAMRAALDVVLRHKLRHPAGLPGDHGGRRSSLYATVLDRLLPAAGHRLSQRRHDHLPGRLLRQDAKQKVQQVAKVIEPGSRRRRRRHVRRRLSANQANLFIA